MSLVTLSEVLQPAFKGGYALCGVVTLGWEDMCAFVQAAEQENMPIILQAGPGCRSHTPLPIMAKMFLHLAQNAQVPVVAHLDHGTSYEECCAAVDLGFSSVMFDGSLLPLRDNIRETAKVVAMAHQAGISCEGEIGVVGYAKGASSQGTNPKEAALFATETNVDAMAISCGNLHLQEGPSAGFDIERLAAIEAVTDVPLVLHGGSGLGGDLRRKLALGSHICKFNIGTELRQTFGAALRDTLAQYPQSFDRIEILSATKGPMAEKARAIIAGLKA